MGSTNGTMEVLKSIINISMLKKSRQLNQQGVLTLLKKNLTSIANKKGKTIPRSIVDIYA